MFPLQREEKLSPPAASKEHDSKSGKSKSGTSFAFLGEWGFIPAQRGERLTGPHWPAPGRRHQRAQLSPGEGWKVCATRGFKSRWCHSQFLVFLGPELTHVPAQRSTFAQQNYPV